MRVLFICEEYPPGKNGGIGTMVRTLGREMVRQGHNVYVIGLYPHGYGQTAYEEDCGVRVWRLRHYTDLGLISNNFSLSDKFLLRILRSSGLFWLDGFFSARRLFRQIKKLVSQENIDIIEMPDWNAFLQQGPDKVDIPAFGIPLVVKFNGSYSYFQKDLGLPLKKKVYAKELALINRAEALASASRYTAAATADLFHIDRPIEILYNSIAIPEGSPAVSDQLAPTHSSPPGPAEKIIFTGSLQYKKGIHSLLEAWNRVSEKHPHARLEIYGKGNISKLKILLQPAALPTVHFNGHVSQETLYRQLAGATAAVFPSYSECFALAPLEAMAVGCAVINTSRASGSELIVDKVNGLLIDPDNRQQIADAIILLLENDTLRRSLAAEGKRTVQLKFNAVVSVQGHIAYYKKVILGFARQSATSAICSGREPWAH